MAQDIILTEGDAVTYTFTVMRDGSAVNLSGYTVTMYLHDDSAAFGTNQVDGGACSLSGGGTGGIFTFPFTTTHTALGTTNTEMKGHWSAKLVSGGIVEWTRQEPFRIVRNPFVPVAS